jgi:Flp pilus assembly protein TadG
MSAALRLLRDRRGAALAEAAVALPVLALIFAGVFSLGAMFFNTQLIETAARDGARYLARTDAPAANEAAARNIVVFGNAAGAGNARVPGLTTADVTISYDAIPNPIDGATGQRTYRGGDPLQVVQVEVSWEAAAGLWSLFGEDTVTYRASNEQRVVGD